MSTRETILAAIATTLAGVASGRVYRSRREAIETLPAVVIEPRSEEADENALGVLDRTLHVGISVYAKGDTPDNAADATLSAVWAALAAAPQLGQGTDVQIDMAHQSVEWDFEDYDYARAILNIDVGFRTASNAM